MDADSFVAPFVLEYSYKRSLGPVLSQFFTALRDGRILGATTADGRVLVPPTEYDPQTGDDVQGLVEVGPAGVVRSWTWVSAPQPQHPRDHPFAFALIRLDGANTDLLHVVDCAEAQLQAGLRVTARFADAPAGGLSDLVGFEVVDG